MDNLKSSIIGAVSGSGFCITKIMMFADIQFINLTIAGLIAGGTGALGGLIIKSVWSGIRKKYFN